MSGNTNKDILLAGAVAAFTVDLLVYPLDTLKTRLQSPEYAKIYINSTTQKPNHALFRGLYQGVGSVIIATLPASGAFFTTYERSKSFLKRINPSTSTRPDGFIPAPFIHAGASSLAELVACAILTPAEVIKQNAQMVQAGSKTNATVQTLSKFKSNPLALWRGYAALAGRNLPFTALHFPMFEKMKERIKMYRDARGKTTGTIFESGLITAVSAGSAGSVAAVLTTPVDVIKTRIMLSAGEDAVQEVSVKQGKAKGGSEGRVNTFGKSMESSKDTAKSMARNSNPLISPETKGKKSVWEIGREIVREKGAVGLWRGGALRGVWTFIGSGLYLGAYESGRVYLATRRGEKINEDDLV